MPPDEPPIIVAIISDLHAGSTVGLCPPRFTLDDGGDYVSSPAQRWLWRNWNHFWAKGYCVDTMGLDETKIRTYVQYQEKQERIAQQQHGFDY